MSRQSHQPSAKTSEKIQSLLTQAVACHQQGQLQAAQEAYRQILRHQPSHFDALHLLGVIAGQTGQSEQAAALIARALVINPRNAQAHLNLGNALFDLGRFTAAVQHHTQAIALQPDYADAYLNRGNAWKQQQRYQEAAADYEAAIARQPDSAIYRWNLACLKLLIGDYAAGWALYEWRWQYPDFTSPLRRFRQPLWLGGANLAGQSILLHAEQGYGDTLQFCRYVPLIAAQAGQTFLEAPPALLPVLATLKADITLIAQGQPLPATDWHCPLLSLPLACRTTLDTVPAALPYLYADPGRLPFWRQRLTNGNGLRVGLAWAGSGAHRHDSQRSIPLADLVFLNRLPVQWHSLQKQVNKQDSAVLVHFPNLHLHHAHLHDFADTAALIASLDLIISVDTAVAHLAGALGKPLWLLLSEPADFRWLTAGSDSPWYPGARLFRAAPADREQLLDELRQSLATPG
ncbi:MAG: tetratricopeptide repeat protein [Methylococcales bacterium]|nr:tetratricopeptide repeat protein [Methylococcales bacterium]